MSFPDTQLFEIMGFFFTKGLEGKAQTPEIPAHANCRRKLEAGVQCLRYWLRSSCSFAPFSELAQVSGEGTQPDSSGSEHAL